MCIASPFKTTPKELSTRDMRAWLVLSNVASASLVWLIWLGCVQLGSSCGFQEEGLGGSGRELSGELGEDSVVRTGVG